MKLIKNNEVEIKAAEQKLRSFRKDYDELRAKYPDIRIGDPWLNNDLLVAYTHIGTDNYREVILKLN